MQTFFFRMKTSIRQSYHPQSLEAPEWLPAPLPLHSQSRKSGSTEALLDDCYSEKLWGSGG